MNGINLGNLFMSDGDTILIGTNHPLTTSSGAGYSIIGINGIQLNGNLNISNNAYLKIGDGNKNHILGRGINVISSGTLITSSSSTGTIPSSIIINGTTQEGILNSGTVTLDSTIVHIDSVDIGIHNIGAMNILNATKVDIGKNDGGVCTIGLQNSNGILSTNNEGTHIRIMSAPISIQIDGGTITNNAFSGETGDDDCVIIEFYDSLKVNTSVNAFVNNGILISMAPLNTSIGVSLGLNNNGVIADSLGSFLPNLSNPRSLNALVNNAGGILVAPYSGANFLPTIPDYLITDLLAPFTNQYQITNFSGATHSNVTNDLTLGTVSTSFNLPYQIQKQANDSICAISSASINFTNVPADEIACNSGIQLSLNKHGIGVITPAMVLETDLSDYTGFTVEVLSGALAGSDTVDCSYIGRTVDVLVTAPGLNGNSCWGRVTVEDKLAPVLMCRDTFVYCMESLDPAILGFPQAIDSCGGPITFAFVDDSPPQTNVCGQDPSNPDTLSVITRLFTATDQFGNSDTCTQKIRILRPVLDSIKFPTSFTGANPLQCGNSGEDLGRPFFVLNGDTVPVETVCKFGVSLEERVYNLGCPGKTRTIRTWSIWDWCHLASGNGVRVDTQVIDRLDTIAPTFDSVRASDIIVLNAFPHKCMANIQPPAPSNIVETCSGAFFEILGPTGTIYNSIRDTLFNVPLGTHTLEYIVRDSCGNESRDTVTFTLEDVTDPLAIAQELTINLVDSLGNTWVYATSLDAGSFDNCGVVDSILFSRDSINYFEALAFDCAYVGTITLFLRVYDDSGNFATVSREVQITDTGGFCSSNLVTPTELENQDSLVENENIPPEPNCDDLIIDTVKILNEVSSCDNQDGIIQVNELANTDFEYSIDGGITWSDSRIITNLGNGDYHICLLYTSPSPRDRTRSRMPSSA